MLLLDTHVLVWLVEESAPPGRQMARQADAALVRDGLAVASISFWGLAMWAHRGRIALELSFERWRPRVLALGVREVPLTGDIAIAAARLAGLPADPADRTIVATGLASDATLVSVASAQQSGGAP